MPPEARVAIIDDFDVIRRSFGRLLTQAGHNVVAQAGSMPEALALIPKLGDLGVEVVLLDGNLTPGRSDGTDGRFLAKEIKRVAPDTIIVGISGDDDGVRGADFNLRKPLEVKLGEFVTNL